MWCKRPVISNTNLMQKGIFWPGNLLKHQRAMQNENCLKSYALHFGDIGDKWEKSKREKYMIILRTLYSTKYTKWMKHFPQQDIFYICRKIVLCLDVYWQHSMDRSIFLLNGMVGNCCRRYGWHTSSGKNHSIIGCLKVSFVIN